MLAKSVFNHTVEQQQNIGILDAVGKTPIVKLENLLDFPGFDLYGVNLAKLPPGAI